MRMDDAVAVGKLDIALHKQGDVDPSTRILYQLTSDGIEPATPLADRSFDA